MKQDYLGEGVSAGGSAPQRRDMFGGCPPPNSGICSAFAQRCERSVATTFDWHGYLGGRGGDYVLLVGYLGEGGSAPQRRYTVRLSPNDTIEASQLRSIGWLFR
jgi:hypothetical protein